MDRRNRLRRLRLAARQRGVLEVEWFLVPFVDRHLDELSDPELDSLEILFDLPDLDFLEVLLGRRDPPPGVDPSLPAAIRMVRRPGVDIRWPPDLFLDTNQLRRGSVVDKELVLAAEQIQARVRELAAQLSTEFTGKRPLFIGILNGAFIFLSDLVRHLAVPVQIDFIRLASYGASDTSSGRITMTKDLELPLEGRDVVVVEDIVDTGLTLRWLVDQLRSRGPASVKVCALIDKKERREVEVEVDYVGFEVPDGFLVGYGLDFNEDWRHLPAVYALKK
ncbi:MAG: hypoxanthine phosphoribosyltransferase [Proteobacteria bacterium]|nr:hypoxanthine phosphoribosyltransferase [Pseudomonadota bacterium]MBU1742413.1 hypoxanthine phosphoribosyltransferase [Pseudomonadota bacterium]